MDWLFETPWTLWVALALVFAVIEMLSLDLFFLMLAISAGITAAISPFVDNMLIRYFRGNLPDSGSWSAPAAAEKTQ